MREVGILRRWTAGTVALALLLPLAGTFAEDVPPARSPGEDHRALGAILAGAAGIEDCDPVSPPQFFDRGSLWDYINGAADAYLRYGFQLLLVSDRMALGDSTRIALEVYRMETPLHAFGIYSAERPAGESPVPVDVEGYGGAGYLCFWKGPYYVKILARRSSESTSNLLRELAAAVSASIPGEYHAPPLFQCFPEKGRVERSERFVPDNFLGHAFLKNGYLADYRSGGGPYRVFLADLEMVGSAADAFERYGQYLRDAGYSLLQEEKPDHRVVRTSAGEHRVIQYGPYVGGIQGLEDEHRGRAVEADLLARLREANGPQAEKARDE